MPDSHTVVRKYFEEHSFIDSNLQSFNKFIEVELQRIVNENSEIMPTITPTEAHEFKIKFDNIWIEKPSIVEADGSTRPIYPMEARLRQLTYSAPMHLEVSVHVDGVQRESFTTLVGKMPIMLKSKACLLHGMKDSELEKHGEDPNDPGGYFILNGNERVLITVEDLMPNKVFIGKSSDQGASKYTAKIFSQRGSYSIPHTIEMMKDGIIYLTFTRFKRIPIIAVIKALGFTKDSDIQEMASPEGKEYDEMYINLFNSLELKNMEDALELVAKKMSLTQPKEVRIQKAQEQLDQYLLPHVGITSRERYLKAYNLCKLIKRFLMVAKDNVATMDKDHYKNKKLKLSGNLMADLMRVNMKVLVNDINYNFQRLVKRGKFQSVKIIIRDKLLTSRIKSAMATGSWVGGRKGISQNIERTNFIATMSHLNRVVSQLSATQENFEAREIHSTHWSRLCLKKDTNVLLADRYSTRNLETLQNCWNHQKVTTFDAGNKQLKTSSISSYFTSNPKLMGKRTYKLISESGREIVATQDHPFYTKNGWKDASTLKLGDHVAVYPTLDTIETPKLPTQELGLEIVNEGYIENNYPKRFKHYIKELHSRELLPLTANNYKIEIIARLLGHLFSDGHCGKDNLEFYCGCKEDAEAVAKDIRLLGFEPSKITKKQTKIKKNERIANYTTYMLSKGGSLHALLVAAGAPIGKKTDLEIKAPNWIFASSLAVKREFLAALLGGDGPKPRASLRKDRKSGYQIKIDNIIFHKKEELKNNITQFSNDIKGLFGEFNINIKRIIIDKDYIRKDGAGMLKCSIIFAKSQENISRILNKVGYRYCLQKEINSQYIGEWLRLRDYAIRARIESKDKVKELYNHGILPKEISKMLNINYRVVNGWLFESNKYEKTRLSQRLLPDYEKWLLQNKVEDSGAVWEKIMKKEAEELNDVRDFTTAEDTHSFIANGFITHNCPIETPEGTPIGLRKNLAMLCQITQEEVSDDKVKKLLEASGLKIVK